MRQLTQRRTRAKTIIELQIDENCRIGPIRQGSAQFHSCGCPGPVPAPQTNGDYTTIVLVSQILFFLRSILAFLLTVTGMLAGG